MVVSSVLTVMSLALHGAMRLLAKSSESASLVRWHPAGWWFVPFLVYAAANVLWVTPVRWLGWRDWLGWAQMIVVFWIVINDLRARAVRKLLFLTLLAGATLAAGLACYQRFVAPDWLMLGAKQMPQFLARPSGSFAVPNSFAGLLILLLPATALPLWRRSASAVQRVAWGYVALLLLLALALTVSRGAWLSLVLAVALWPLALAGRSWRRRIGISAAILAAAAAAVVVVYASMPAARERLDYLRRDVGERSRPGFWRAAWLTFRAHPVMGSGAGSYAVEFEKFRPEHEGKDPQWTHNDYLNTLSDYGVVGFTLFFGAGAVVAWQCARSRRFQSAKIASAATGPALATSDHDWLDSRAFTIALGVGLLAFGFHLFVDFHLKIPALAMAAAIVAGLGVIRAWPRTESEEGEKGTPTTHPALRRVAAALIVVGAIAGAVRVVPYYRAEALRREHRLSLDALAGKNVSAESRRATVESARAAFGAAVAMDPSNDQAWADRAYTAAILGHDETNPARVKELGQSAEADARRALALSRAVPEFWLRLGVALDMQGRWAEAMPAFTEALRLAPVNSTAWFYYAYHLSLNRQTRALARAAVATCLRLDPSRVEGESLRQKLAASP